jgi:hypothetical protein
MTTDANNVLAFRCAEPDFGLAVSSASVPVIAGVSAIYSVTITRDPTFAAAVTLGVSDAHDPNLPPGTTASFITNRDRTVTLTIATNVGITTPPGTYPLVVFGRSGSLSHGVSASLIVE